MAAKTENRKLRQISADYERVKRVFGPEQVEVAVQADKQREQAEKGRKRPRALLIGGSGKSKGFVFILDYSMRL